MRELGHCVKSFPAHPRDSQRGWRLDSVVAIPRVKMMSRAPPTPLFNSLSPMNRGTVVLEYSRAIWEDKIHWWKNLVIQYIQYELTSSDYISYYAWWVHHFIRLSQLFPQHDPEQTGGDRQT